MEFNADVAAVGVDKDDNVYAFNRGKHPMCVFDREGNLLRTWGEGIFPRAHGVFMAPDETIWLTDDADHTVRQCTLDGNRLLTIGVPGKPAPDMSGGPFHRCTHTAMSPDGKYLYISDGYGNARIHKFTVDGKWVSAWGEPGTEPGSSTSRTTSAATPMAGSMSPIARTTASRCSTATVNTRRSGSICTAPPGCAWTTIRRRRALCRRNRPGHGGQHRHARLRAAGQHIHRRASLARLGQSMPGWPPGSPSRRTGSPSTYAATSMSARSATPTGAVGCAPGAKRSRRASGACRNW